MLNLKNSVQLSVFSQFTDLLLVVNQPAEQTRPLIKMKHNLFHFKFALSKEGSCPLSRSSYPPKCHKGGIFHKLLPVEFRQDPASPQSTASKQVTVC